MKLSQLLKFANYFLKARALETGLSNILNFRSPQTTPTCWIRNVELICGPCWMMSDQHFFRKKCCMKVLKSSNISPIFYFLFLV